ncbi:MAG: hypothetical protein GXO62_07135 [Epsilonproteobacteria bacterium]|nr:hypothetical protein [Campylobacterota bacterium]
MRYLLLFIGSFLFAWQLIGGYEGNISNLNPYISWKYENGKWLGYSDDEEIKQKIIQNYGYFEYLHPKEGAWVKNGVEFEPKRELFYSLKSGWNLLGGIKLFDISPLGVAWKYDGSWKNSKGLLGYPKFDVLSAGEGVWVYSDVDKNLSLNYTKFMPYYPVGGGDVGLSGDFAYSFVISDGGCNPQWDWDMQDFYAYKDVVKSGMISFGGAGAEEKSLAFVCGEDELYNTYKNIIDTFGIKWLDFDIEGGMLSESEANKKRFDVLKRLKSEYPEVVISLTLPVMPYGFDDEVKNIITLAKNEGLNIDVYNLMLMDYSQDYAANNPDEAKMFEYSQKAIENVNTYLKSILDDKLIDGNYYHKIGAVAMIGVNDIQNEVWYRNDFALLKDYVLKKGLRVLSFWNILRDKAGSSVDDSTALNELYGKSAYEYYNIGKLSTLNAISHLSVGDDFYIQLTGDLKYADAKIYEVDMFDTSKESIKALKEKGKTVICYINAGAWEDWREDASLFPSSVIGKDMDGWEGEKWLDIRSELVREIMKKRMDLAFEKGCDGIDPDNINGYTNDTGFDLTYDNQLEYNKFLAVEAKKRGLLIAQKNDFEQTDELAPYFDFMVAEEALEYNLTQYFKPYIIQNKPIYDIEYKQEYFQCQSDFKVYLRSLALDGSLYKKCEE